MSAMPVSRHRHRSVDTPLTHRPGNRASALVSTGYPGTCSRPNRGVVSLRHSVFGPKSVGMSMLRSIVGAFVRAATRVPSPFRSRASGVSGGYPPETDGAVQWPRRPTGVAAVDTRPRGAITAGRRVPR